MNTCIYIAPVKQKSSEALSPTSVVSSVLNATDVKRGQNLEAEARVRGQGQFLEVEAKAEAKNNYGKKYQVTGCAVAQALC